MGFIENIAPLIQKYSPQYGICVCSPIIAQAVLESASGTSELAVYANNYFGIKYREGRCKSACGIYYKSGSEQNADGSYTSSPMAWCKFQNMEMGVKGYFEFISTERYSNLKGISDPKTYLDTIKSDGYATSLNYVDNLMNVIDKYDLTRYDNLGKTESEVQKMRINVHAGHNPDGKVACGAVGLIKESTENRRVKDEVISQLRQLGHSVYDCTVDNGTSASDVLKKIVEKCNAHTVDLDVSIHFNSGAADKTGNGSTTGSEAYVYSTSSKAKSYAEKVCQEIADLGFKNRGVKCSTSLYVLKNTKAPAMLIECCFVDDRDDVQLYDYKDMASAIVKGITGQSVQSEEEPDDLPADAETEIGTAKKLKRVQVGAYSVQENAEAMLKRVKAAGFTDAFITSA